MNKIINFIAGGLLLLSGSVFAATLTYSITGTGSGSLAGNSFTNADYAISLVGDSANYESSGYQVVDPLSSASITINGLGTATFDIATRLGLNGNVVFFSRAGSGSLDLLDFVLQAPVDLQSSFGPLIGTDIFALNQFVDVSTSLGLLSLNESGNVNFSAGVVPEPETYAMLLAGLGLTVVARRRARAKASNAA